MAVVYGYLLSEDERQSINFNPRAPAKIFMYSDEKYVYNEKARKIAMLLILRSKKDGYSRNWEELLMKMLELKSTI